MTAQRIGLFGGTFDPPHLAHLALARAARDMLALHRVHWLPAGMPWQKSSRSISPAQHRAAMVQLTIADQPGMQLDSRELCRSGPSYTLDSVRELQAEFATAGGMVPVQIFLLIGSDQHDALHTWHGWQALLDAVVLAVAVRPDARSADAAGAAGAPHPDVLRHGHRVLPLPLLAVSSSDIRHRVAHRMPIGTLVAPSVERYIVRHRLYEAAPGS